jgi:hypothetical protein
LVVVPDTAESIAVFVLVVARIHLERYEQLRHDFGDWRDVAVVLDRREGDRRVPDIRFAGTDRRRRERRRRPSECREIGWIVIETNKGTKFCLGGF